MLCTYYIMLNSPYDSEREKGMVVVQCLLVCEV
jgi:hypothetical protein